MNTTQQDALPRKDLSVFNLWQTAIDSEPVSTHSDDGVAREHTQSTANDSSVRVCVCVGGGG